MNDLKQTTPGPYITGVSKVFGVEQISVVRADDTTKIVAITGVAGAEDENESIANAALFAIAPDMLDALIAIQESIHSGLGLDEDAVNTMISEIFAKLANEAGEEVTS